MQSFGTEGRRKNPAEEVPPSSTVYEYIVFRGSDVSDISIADEETKENAQPEPPRVPDDPAILGVGFPIQSFLLRFFLRLPTTSITLPVPLRSVISFDQMMKYIRM